MGQILNEYDIGIYKGTRNIFSVLSIVGSGAAAPCHYEGNIHQISHLSSANSNCLYISFLLPESPIFVVTI